MKPISVEVRTYDTETKRGSSYRASTPSAIRNDPGTLVYRFYRPALTRDEAEALAQELLLDITRCS